VIVVEGKKYPIAILDDGTTGDYSNLANTEVLIPNNQSDSPDVVQPWRTTSRSGRASTNRSINGPQPKRADSAFKLGDEFYMVSAIARDGSTIAINKAVWGKLQGRILDPKTGKEIGEALVSVSPAGLSAKTEPDGRVSLELPEGRYFLITVSADGYIPTHDEHSFAIAAGLPVEVSEALTALTAPKSGKISLHDRDSFHFLAQTMTRISGGDFYLSFSDGNAGKFWANKRYQGGVLDIGSMGSKPLDQVLPPSIGYTRFGVAAVLGHVYASPAKEGDNGHYVIFRVTSLGPDKSVEIEYYYR
jgi:hypothetical protein